MLKRVIRTCLSILMLVYELEFRSSSASYILINTIVVSTPFRTPVRCRYEVVRLIPTFPEATDAGLLSY